MQRFDVDHRRPYALPMAGTDLQRWLCYRRAAGGQHVVAGRLALAEMARLRAVIEPPASDDAATARLAFFEDDQRWARIAGRVQCAVSLDCGRCLRPTAVAIDAAIAAAVVDEDAQAARVPRELEPALADGEWLDLRALVEDEILLTLPGTVFCARADCEPAAGDAASDRRFPFADLGTSLASDRND